MTFRMTSEKQFHSWLKELPEQIEKLKNILLSDKNQYLDFSIASLQALEQWLLMKYTNLNDVYEVDEFSIIEAAGGYVGETIRRNIGGEWIIELQDQEYAFLGIPGITGFRNDRNIPPVYPRTWVTASLDRRTGEFIFSFAVKLKNKVDCCDM